MADGPDNVEDSGLAALIDERQHLTNLAYRLLGSLADAEDVVQETFARWYAMPVTQRADIASPGAWATTVASRICLDLLGSARKRRERYVGEWIPEPVPGGTDWIGSRSGAEPSGPVDPADRVTLDESINMAFMVVLESMTPAERVAFILHDVFRYSFPEVADMVGRTPAACRQLATSARQRLRGSATAPDPVVADHAELVKDFKQAWEAKNIHALVELLDPDAMSTADGGGVVTATYDVVRGADTVARTLIEVAGKVPGLTLVECTVNGQPGLAARHNDITATVVAFEFAAGRIKHVWAIRNPDKLRPWTTG